MVKGGGSNCAVALCDNYALKAKKEGRNDLIFHRFPKDADVLKVWAHRCRRKGEWNPSRCFICSDHFTSDSYERDLKAELLGCTSKKRLKKGAVPTLKLPHRPDTPSTSGLLRKKPMEARQALQMPSCCVPNCSSEKGPVKHFFSVPAENVQQWQEAIPGLTRKLNKRTSRICDIHFGADDIVKFDTIVIEGENVQIEKANWCLRNGAVPTVFPSGLEKSSKVRARKNYSSSCNSSSTILDNDSVPADEEPVSVVCEVDCSVLDLSALSFSELLAQLDNLSLPGSNWRAMQSKSQKPPYTDYIWVEEHLSRNEARTVQRSVLIKEDMVAHAFLYGKLLAGESKPIKCLRALEVYLQNFHLKNLCEGCGKFSLLGTAVTYAEEKNGVWFSIFCQKLPGKNKPWCECCGAARARLQSHNYYLTHRPKKRSRTRQRTMQSPTIET